MVNVVPFADVNLLSVSLTSMVAGENISKKLMIPKKSGVHFVTRSWHVSKPAWFVRIQLCTISGYYFTKNGTFVHLK